MTDAQNIFQMIKDFVVETIDDAAPLERTLAANRHVQGQKVRDMANSATSVGAMANDMAQQLGEEKAVLAELLAKATKRRQGFATKEEAEKDKEYVRLCNEIAKSREEVAEIEQMVKDSFADKAEAIAMVLEQSENVSRLERTDANLVRKSEMIGLREQQQAMKENMLRVFPEDQSDVRERASKKLDKRVNRLAARKDVTNALWEQKTSGSPVEADPDGAGVMEEIEKSL